MGNDSGLLTDPFLYRNARRITGSLDTSSTTINTIIGELIDDISGGIEDTFQGMWDTIAGNSADIAAINGITIGSTPEGNVRTETWTDA